MDIRMPNLDGIEATHQIVATHPDLTVLILTSFEADSYVIQALKAGASGYMLKDSQADAVVSSILAVAAGRQVVSGRVVSRVLEMVTRTIKPIFLGSKRLEPCHRRLRQPSRCGSKPVDLLRRNNQALNLANAVEVTRVVVLRHQRSPPRLDQRDRSMRAT
jgi:DNA-binding response OmpR family regulator